MRSALLSLFLLWVPQGSLAAQVALTRPQICEHAHRIVVGEVTDIEARIGSEDRIERRVQLRVERTLKGPVSDEAVVTAPGGTLGGISLWVEHSPVFLTEARYLLFLSADGTVVAGEQGSVRITRPGAFVGETLDSAVQSLEGCHEK